MKRSFTLIEMITTLAIIGVSGALFYSVFFLNWSGFYNEISRVNLWQDANNIIDDLSSRGEMAKNAAVSSDSKSLTLNFSDGTSVVYNVVNSSPYGGLKRTKGSTTDILSENINYTNSSFSVTAYSFIVNLALQDKIFNRNININTSTQICFRNQ